MNSGEHRINLVHEHEYAPALWACRHFSLSGVILHVKIVIIYTSRDKFTVKNLQKWLLDFCKPVGWGRGGMGGFPFCVVAPGKRLELYWGDWGGVPFCVTAPRDLYGRGRDWGGDPFLRDSPRSASLSHV